MKSSTSEPGLSQLVTVHHIQFTVRDGWVKFNVSDSQNFERAQNASFINSVPKSTVYKDKWAIQILREWQGQRANKICSIEPGGVFKGEDIGLDVQELSESIENMNAKSLNYWLCKFVQEVANKSGGRYPSRTLYNIVRGLKRFLVEMPKKKWRGRIKSGRYKSRTGSTSDRWFE